MSTEVAVRRPQGQAAAIPAKLAYARELANSGLLPGAYRKNPANVLWAVEYGDMLGLAPMAAMTGVHVIEGKPTASAGLISALVRRAGHKLRVRGDGRSATVQIVRADDPDFTFEVTWTLKRNAENNPSAEEAGLLGKNIWKNYPASMLKSRAITQCARDACEEALFGLHYTPEELGAEVDEDGAVLAEVVDEPAQQPDGQPAAAPGDDPWYVRPSPEQEWLAAALEAAPGHASLDACGAAWTRGVEHVRDGKLTAAEVGRLQDLLRKRIEELKVPAAPAEMAPGEPEAGSPVADGLDPEDPWASAVEALASTGDAEALLEDLIDQRGRGEIDPERAALIETAIEAKMAQFSEGQVAA